MEHLKKKKRFSWRDLLYKSLLFVGTVTLIVYFLPRDGKFNYQFDINKPWKYGQLIATFDFPIYKEDAVVKREQDSLMAFFQPYYQLDKNIEKDAIAKLKENYHTNLKGILPSIDYLRYIERTLKEIYQAGGCPLPGFSVAGGKRGIPCCTRCIGTAAPVASSGAHRSRRSVRVSRPACGAVPPVRPVWRNGWWTYPAG